MAAQKPIDLDSQIAIVDALLRQWGPDARCREERARAARSPKGYLSWAELCELDREYDAHVRALQAEAARLGMLAGLRAIGQTVPSR